MDDALAAFVRAARISVDAALERFLPRPPICPPLISEAMRYSLFAGGKRLRPVLALAAFDAVQSLTIANGELAGPHLVSIVPVACALEMLHTYSLVHDDLPAMDDDTLRRGRPTLHVVYGEGVAILAGDALQAEAFALIAREGAAPDPQYARRTVRTIQTIAQAVGAAGMVGGQTIDLQAAGQVASRRVELDGDALKEMHLRKTGALIRASAVSGAIMAGADPSTEAAIDRWATEVGLAFQIVDDVLDVEGTAAELGKTAGKDASNAKPTYPTVFGLERSRQMAADCAERASGILIEARLTRGYLPHIGDWVIGRTN